MPLFPRRRRKLAVLRLSGVIAARDRALSLAALKPLIDRAFRVGDEVALVINSPGGSPAQSQLIHDYIRIQADRRKKAVTTFVEDVAASGGYWIALAGDSIRVLPTSLVGSIGVVSAGFGFVEALDRLGVERRLVAAGRNKVRLDPFSPRKDEDTEWLTGLQAQLHERFIEHVRSRRAAHGARLPESGELFTGEVWLGREAIAHRLADQEDSLGAYVDRQKMRLREIAPRRMFSLRGLIGGLAAETLGALEARIEDRALRAPFGL
ncbi:peptidase S46 [Rhodospirillum rubrum]|uniref:S49 family peptidase n=1 Tax=Rhodospirillum rubrum TaxID=1085 RepID=UPI001905FB5D|nr:S49 family peptidase [Rhodospirillum rubrum]MBK1664650.1 peptidase S46 [Rhodospirillum rubrum]MBK1676331.1 peptidase S46 [Rhodospirillum rubrum]